MIKPTPKARIKTAPVYFVKNQRTGECKKIATNDLELWLAARHWQKDDCIINNLGKRAPEGTGYDYIPGQAVPHLESEEAQ